MKNDPSVAHDRDLARVRAAFDAILTPQDAQPRHDPDREVPMREGCDRMQLTRLVFKKKLEDQRAKIQRGEVINGAHLPEPHLDERGCQCVWQWQIDAYVGTTKSADRS
jgi:hypothetical protein